MRNLRKFVWFCICLVIIVIDLIASFSAFIPPSSFSFISLFAIGFPYIYAATILCCIISFFVNRRLAFLLLLVLISGVYNLKNTVAFNAPKDWHFKKNDSTLRVMTWNVEGFVNSAPQSQPEAETRIKMLGTIHEFKPDVLCLQEYRNSDGVKWAASVRHELDSLGYKYSFVSNDAVFQTKKEMHVYGVAIFSRYPFTDSGRVTISTEPRLEKLVYGDIAFNNKTIRLFTAHLVSFYLYADTTGNDIYKITYNRKRSIQSKIRETERQHEKEVKIIRKEINKSPHPVIYCGDLNTTPASYNYRVLRGDLQDAFLQKGFGIGSTFYKIAPTLRIDVCLADKAFSVLQSQVIERKLSDHYPVITDIAWKP